MKSTKLSTSVLAALFICVVASTGCSKDEATPAANDIWKINATLNSAQEVPVNPSTATGTATGTLDATTNIFSYTTTWAGLTGPATVGHFHSPALAGANASPLVHFVLINNGTSGTASGSVTLTDAQEADLLAGKFYANVHTGTYGGGEIRGQVAATR